MCNVQSTVTRSTSDQVLDPFHDGPPTANPSNSETTGVQGQSKVTVHPGDQANVAQPQEPQPQEPHHQELQKVSDNPFQTFGERVQRPNFSWSKSEADRRGNNFLLFIFGLQQEQLRHPNATKALNVIRKYLDTYIDKSNIKEAEAPVSDSEAESANADIQGDNMIWQEWIYLFDTTPHFWQFAPKFLQDGISRLNRNREAMLRAPSMTLALGSQKSLTVEHHGVTWPDYVLRVQARYRLACSRIPANRVLQPPIQGLIRPQGASSRPVAKRKMPEQGQETEAQAAVNSGRKKPKMQPRWSLLAMQFFMDTSKTQLVDFPVHAREGPSHELESHCTPVQTNITLCILPISIEEVLTYFPLHTEWRLIGARLQAHSWTAQRCIEYIYWSRQLQHEQTLLRTKLQYHFKVGLGFYNTKADASVSAIPVDMDNTKGKQKKAFNKDHDYYLVDLAEGVAVHPEGRGKQALTRAILHARANGDTKVKLSEVREYVKANIPFLIPDDYNCRKEDFAARERFDKSGEMTKYYRAVTNKQPA